MTLSSKRESTIRRIQELLQIREEILFAYIFGSVARQQARPDSDVDIALYVTRKRNFFSYRLKILRLLEKALHQENIDVVILNEAPLSLRFLVQKQGMLLFEKSHDARIRFEVQTMKEYWDYEPYLLRFWEAIKYRLQEGTFGS